MDVLFKSQSDPTTKVDKIESGNVFFDKKDELLSSEGYFSLSFFIDCFKEIIYKSIPRIVNFLFNLMTLSLINIYLLGMYFYF